MSFRPRLSIVIPTYRGAHRLRRLFQSFVESEMPRDDVEILVGDDGSPQEDAIAIRQECTDLYNRYHVSIRHLRAASNAGPVAMLRKLVDETATYDTVLQLDDDVRIPSETGTFDFWHTLNHLMSLPNIGCVSWRSQGHGAGQSQKPKPALLELATEIAGYCYAYPKRVYNLVGGIDTRFRVYCSDSDFALRAMLAGHPCYRVWWPLVPHDEHMSSKENPNIAKVEKASQSADTALFFEKWGATGKEMEARAIEHLRREEG